MPSQNLMALYTPSLLSTVKKLIFTIIYFKKCQLDKQGKPKGDDY